MAEQQQPIGRGLTYKAEDTGRRSHGDGVTKDKGSRGASKTCQQVDRQKSPVTQDSLYLRSHRVQGICVERQVAEAVVQEC